MFKSVYTHSMKTVVALASADAGGAPRRYRFSVNTHDGIDNAHC